MTDQLCPICGNQVQKIARYPKYICRDCLSGGIEVDGKIVHIASIDIRNTMKVECLVKGTKCILREAHFGGVVVEAI